MDMDRVRKAWADSERAGLEVQFLLLVVLDGHSKIATLPACSLSLASLDSC
jgi:hypothetical protein